MRKLLSVLFGLSLVFAVGVSAQAGQPVELIDLPDPNLEVDGIVVASKYGDFYTYPVSLIEDLSQASSTDSLDLDDWSSKGGSGLLEFQIYSGSGGHQNPVIPRTGDTADPGKVIPDENFEVALDGSKGGATVNYSFHDIWGNGSGESKGPGPVLVSDVLDYLHTFDQDYNVPVFGFDLNETGANSALWAKARAYIVDQYGAPVDGASWILNDPTGGQEFVDFGLITVGDLNPDFVYAPQYLALQGTSLAWYEINNANTGSGFVDYFIVAPNMDLSQYAAEGNRLYIELNFEALDDGSEEVYLMGAVAAPKIIPEPATMALFGLGLLGAAFRRKRRG